MSLNLSQKEKMLLKDQKSHEELCINKYTNYANQAEDPQLKQLFKTYASQEQKHLNTINRMLGGQLPDMNQQSTQPQGQQSGNSWQFQPGMENEDDAVLCNDMLMMEKYVSGAYDTSIFEFRDTNIRQALNHIQKEEQQHGEGIYNYMQSHGMYNIQQ